MFALDFAFAHAFIFLMEVIGMMGRMLVRGIWRLVGGWVDDGEVNIADLRLRLLMRWRFTR